MAEVIYGLVSEARKNRFSAIPKLAEEGNAQSQLSSQGVNLFVGFTGLYCFIGYLTSVALLDIVNVWDNVSKFIERQMALQKVGKFGNIRISFCTCNGIRLSLSNPRSSRPIFGQNAGENI